ncbi:MAG: hydroxymethylglutaryl-CoA lyase [Thermomicrobiales bacterium]|nr:hydroxymethylglutaryl-CoA lyase [Thermomicrobiales bacterium]
MTEFVQIVEVGPRDGLQNEPDLVPLSAKLAFVEGLIAAGLREIEATSFVSPKAVPQLADADDLMVTLPRNSAVCYHALVPNERGLERALTAKTDVIALFTSATEAFCQANIRCTVAESFERFAPVVERVRAAGLSLRGYVSVAFVCPFCGDVDPGAAVDIALRLAEIGCDDVCLADTVGRARPEQVTAVFSQLLKTLSPDRLSLHVHDTDGRALDNIDAALELGIRRFDGAAGGLGGCPFAPGAPGNVATQRVVRHLHERGFETGVDPDLITRALDPVLPYLTRPVVT